MPAKEEKDGSTWSMEDIARPSTSNLLFVFVFVFVPLQVTFVSNDCHRDLQDFFCYVQLEKGATELRDKVL